MRRLLPFLILLATAGPAWSHPMPNSLVELRLGRDGIAAALTLPVGELAAGWDRPLPADPARVVFEKGADLAAYLRDHVHAVAPDGRPWAISVGDMTPLPGRDPDIGVSLTLTPPHGAPVDRLTFRYDAIFHRLVTHTAIVTLASDWRNGVTGEEPVLLGTLRDTHPELVIDRSGGSWWRGVAALFRLGARHIAEGTDHLLFLLALLLPAPLVAAGGRWGGPAGWDVAARRIVKVVTAFTLGHSATLVLGAMGWARLPGPLVESAIAASILVSAAHALLPILRGREAWVAGGFGLIHGLAFASTLSGFRFDPWTMAGSVLGFNLGIEAIQCAVIAAVMPWLVLLARSRVYTPIRVGGAVLTGVAAAAWLAERALGWDNPVAVAVEQAAGHAPWLLLALIAAALASTALPGAAKGDAPAGSP